ncbi:FAD/NAD(P)-binding domain-containing protein [Penicillium malachiteum]|uniref:FAD/NAD(P)-binding domain-containing protein n=1 Tax=Penicillium malachiteum TaxID=1324776 RepID=UPI00254742F9|nr:FAD/NAD(P)-binding domain-containing protein [Penicillium malachiteum]KAJ5721496.1 FAD/NAD(P)-binding domain-containing protein [Penicillium malachiteum]
MSPPRLIVQNVNLSPSGYSHLLQRLHHNNNWRGIGGLILAAGLIRRHVRVQIYEAATEFKEIGLGLSIGPAAHRALRLIAPELRDIYDSLVTTHADSPGYEAFRQTWFEIVWGCGPSEGDILMDLKALPSGQTTVRRADFLDALITLIPQDIVHFGKRMESLIEEGEDQNGLGGILLKFEDGDEVRADVVVGCDGIKSKVKESMLVEESKLKQPQYSGMYCYRAVLDMDDMVKAVGDQRARVSTVYLGEGMYGISYPIMRAKKVNVGLYVLQENWDWDTWIRPTLKEDLRRDASKMGRYWETLVEYMPDSSQWALFEHPHLSTFCRSRVAILGDAAHASTPHQGAGAGQAIEDAHVLAELLADSRVQSTRDIVSAFKAYDAIRRPRSQRVVTSSKEGAYLLCLCLDGVGDDGEKLKETLEERMKWIWDLDVGGQVEEARGSMVI